MIKEKNPQINLQQRMMKISTFVFSFCVLAAVALGNTEPDYKTIRESIVHKINSLGTTWKATADSPVAKMTPEEFKMLINPGGFVHDPSIPTKAYTDAELSETPESFDSREQWPNCASIRQIRDQSQCGSCWAFSSVETMSDRTCIKYGYDVILSTEDMLACSGAGTCNGGQPISAFNYWIKKGVVTDKCRAYSLPSCDRDYLKNITNPCPKDRFPTPVCYQNCTSGLDWNESKWYGESAYYVTGEENLMAEISKNGPVTAAFTIYEDFHYYDSGIYKYTSGSYLGGHAVKIIGYGEEDGVKYWVGANSWNEKWGEKGFFRFIRGINDCGIESRAVAGLPK